MVRDSMVVYRSFIDAARNMPAEEYKAVITALFDYGFDGIDSANTPAAEMFMTLVKPQIDANNSKYVNGHKGAEHGKKGGRPKNPTKTPNEPLENPKETP